MPDDTSQIGDAQHLPAPWFGASHGADNYEDAVRLDQVQSIRTSFTPIPNSDGDWNAKVKFTLGGGGQVEMHLNEDGYQTLLARLRDINDSG